jgi:membrane-anchored mycosin MYCP
VRLTPLRPVVGSALLVPLLLVPAPAGAEAVSCEAIGVDDAATATAARSVPLELMGVPRAAELMAARGVTPGEGVRVAILDNGITRDAPAVPLRVAPDGFGPATPVEDGHGTVVAGLVAGGVRERGGAVGVAPGAELVDVRVHDGTFDDGFGGVVPADVVAGLEWVAQQGDVDVVVMALDLPDSPQLRRAVAEVRAQDVVVVASSGNRPTEEGQPGFDDYVTLSPGEDAVDDVFPAGYTDDVFAVSATADGVPVDPGTEADAQATVLLNSATDAAVPVWGAISVAANGSTCRLDTVATSWAAGLGGGVAALLRSAYPDDTAAQIEARMRATASGSLDNPTTATGAGVLQPVEALTRALAPTKRGEVDDLPRQEQPRARVTAPPPTPDPVAGTLADARWWGLVGGAAMVVALLLRPLLTRGRRDLGG